MTRNERTGRETAMAIARERGYLIARANRAGSRLVRDWYRECAREGRVLAIVWPRIRYAAFEIETVERPPRERGVRPGQRWWATPAWSDAAQAAMRAAIRAAWATLPKRTGTRYGMSEPHLYVSTVHIADACPLVERLLAIIVDDATRLAHA